jgi:alpha-amylase
VPAIGDPRNLLLMERGREGFFVVNKAATPLRITAAELAGGQLRGRYRNLRGGESLVIGGRNSRDLTVPARDGIYFLRDPDGA